MPQRLAERLSQVRQRHVVGRAEELAFFKDAVSQHELPFFVLHLWGPDGIGKTTLLAEYGSFCEQIGCLCTTLDGRAIEPSPTAFLRQLAQRLGYEHDESALPLLSESNERRVLLIDSYDSIAALDGWMRDHFLPQLSDQVFVVLASSAPPALDWRADPGWRSVMRIQQLHNFSESESRIYLEQREVPPEQHQAVLEFAHGYPLALSLIADLFAQRRQVQFRPEAAPDMMKSLLAQLVQKVPGPAHRAALEACASVNLMTEALLAAMLNMPDVHELFDWLRSLSFIESGPQGLLPHRTVRAALDADVRWRNPEWHAELHRRARAYYTGRMNHVPARQQQHLLFELIYLHRNNPVVRPFFEWQQNPSLLPEPARPDEWPQLRGWIATHEGDEAASWADFWFSRQPDHVLVFRGNGGQPIGMLLTLALDQATTDELLADPATTAIWSYLQRYAPLRPGEKGTLFRFWLDGTSYQAVSPVQSSIFLTMVRYYLTTPGLAFTMLPCADADFWTGVFAYADLHRLPEADFQVGGRSFGVYGHDWRTTPPAAWLELLGERETATEAVAAPAQVAKPALVVLNQADFAAAVRDVLRDFQRADLLQANPLAQARLVAGRLGTGASPAERASTLQALVREACATLEGAQRDVKLYRALYHTYLQPAPTQEQAAEILDLPFSTFRRHLKAGITSVTELLWQWELNG
ncbi:MAG: ATP-binding protein [Chloroflexaceae bacterium]|jgi:hypothetical protein|nr:ATP-binding protein [Chloroflexaceae bacterium]